MCMEFRDEIHLIGGGGGGGGGGRGRECETPRKSNFMKKRKIVISVKIRKFSRSQITERTSQLELSREI